MLKKPPMNSLRPKVIRKLQMKNRQKMSKKLEKIKLAILLMALFMLTTANFYSQMVKKFPVQIMVSMLK
jgi:hypothetical protein